MTVRGSNSHLPWQVKYFVLDVHQTSLKVLGLAKTA